MDRWTDGQTKTNHLSTTTELFFCLYGEGGKLYKHFVKDKDFLNISNLGVYLNFDNHHKKKRVLVAHGFK